MTVERCPVCGGDGLVDNGFYLSAGTGEWTTSSAEPETCRSCDGKGYLVIEYDQIIHSGTSYEPLDSDSFMKTLDAI